MIMPLDKMPNLICTYSQIYFQENRTCIITDSTSFDFESLIDNPEIKANQVTFKQDEKLTVIWIQID